jgi:hypothetical protein
MSRRRQSFTEKRRARLAMRWDRLDRCEPRSLITEPVSLLGLATGSLRGMVQLGLMQADGGNGTLLNLAQLARQAQQGPTQITKAPAAPASSVPIGNVVPEGTPSGAAGGGMTVQDPSAGAAPPNAGSGPALVELSVSGDGASQASGLSAPWHPAAPTGGGGAMPGRGGSGGPSSALVAAAIPGRASGGATNTGASTPASSSSAGASSALLSTLGLGAGGSASAPSAAHGSAAGAATTTVSRNGLATTLSGGVPKHNLMLEPDVSPAFELDTLDFNNGSLLVPGHEVLATPAAVSTSWPRSAIQRPEPTPTRGVPPA